MGTATLIRTQDDIATMSRDEIVRSHMGIVHQTVERICGPVARARGSFDDLVSAGMVGLLNAADAFEPGRGVGFSTYAHPRVRGAVLDELRRLDSAPRSVRRKRRLIDKARNTVMARCGGVASSSQIASELGIDVNTFWGWELDVEHGSMDSIDAHPAQEATVASAAVDDWAARVEAPDAELERSEDVDEVRKALALLPKQERVVLILSFYEHLKLRQIGEIIGVSESRVSQIRTKALAMLRQSMTGAAT